MSGKDHDQIDDAEFEAFLQGSDPLAQDLAALDQPAPPPALDAAIQARIASALAAERLAELPAANDPVAQPVCADHGGAARSWQSRWQLPLALAAGVAALSIALPLWQDHDPVTEPMLAAAPPPSVPTPAPAAPHTPAAPAATSARAAPAVSAPFNHKAKHANAAPQQIPSPAPAPSRPPSPAATATEAAAQPMVEQGAPPPVAPSGSLASGLMADAARTEAFVRRQRLDNAFPVTASEAKTARNEGLMDYRAAPSFRPAPAPVPGLAPPIAEASPSPQHVAIHGSRIMTPTADESRAQAWLTKIEDLLKTNERPEALAEWQKFRAIYPDYPVPDKLAAHFPPAKN